MYLPTRGFTASLNLSVAAALILQRVIDWFPHFVGDLTPQEQAQVRSSWRDREPDRASICANLQLRIGSLSQVSAPQYRGRS